jgi:hypothetical protein
LKNAPELKAARSLDDVLRQLQVVLQSLAQAGIQRIDLDDRR